MMAVEDTDIEELLRRVDSGSQSALRILLDCHRDRLRRMVSVRMDSRIASRVDPSDVVQEALAEASRKLPDYLRQKPLPFYPWLRQLAWDQLVSLRRRHVQAQKRSVLCEDPIVLPDQSAMELAERVLASGTSPSGRMIRKELRGRVTQALDQLAATDREVLVMRYLEQLSSSEVAAVLGISERTVQSRHRQALERLQGLLSDIVSGEES